MLVVAYRVTFSWQHRAAVPPHDHPNKGLLGLEEGESVCRVLLVLL